MPPKTITVLSCVFSGLVVTYLALVVTTVSLAAWRTDLAAELRATEGTIATLEHSYYVAIESIGHTDPFTLGLVHPSTVTYAVMAPAPALSKR